MQGDDQPVYDLETHFGILMANQSLGEKSTGPTTPEFQQMQNHLGQAWVPRTRRTFIHDIGDERDAAHDGIRQGEVRQLRHAVAVTVAVAVAVTVAGAPDETILAK